ncbi:MAG: GTPase ObgE, partial [Bacteroidetes bacterium SW_10_40_5]
LDVPLGTVVKSIKPDQKLYEIVEDGQQYVVARGGKGGLGNTHFKSSTNQTPRYAEPGEAGDEIWVILELKLLADVGLVGFPNAGKSTLLSVLSAARPQIADYPFTTTRPNLGVVPYREDLSFVMADVPGLLEGAHEGKGLGTRFLRHIERNALLLFVISAETLELQNEYETLLGELEGYDTQLLRKKRVLAISKADMLDNELKEALQPNLKEVPHVFISSVTGAGILKLKRLLWQKLHEDEGTLESSEE